MAISCIKGQAVNFCGLSDINRPGEKTHRTLVQQGDTFAAMVRLTPYNSNNRVSEGDFATAATWTFGTGWSHDSGNQEADASSSSGTLSGLVTVTTDYYYRIKWTIKNYIAGQLSTECPIGTVRNSANFSNQTFTYHWVQTIDGTGVEFNASAFTGSVDDVEVVAMSTVGIRVVDESGTIVFSDYNNSNGFVTYLDEGGAAPDLNDPYPQIPKATIEFSWNALGLSAGCYRVELVDTAETLEDGTASGSLVTVLSSQYFNLATTHNDTVLLSWTNEDKFSVGNGNVIDYNEFSSFTQYLRIKAWLGDSIGERQSEVYRYGDGTMSTPFSRQIIRRILHTDNLPDNEHNAIFNGLGHDTFNIDGSRYFYEQDEYSPRWRRTSKTAPIDIEVYSVADQYENRAANAPEVAGGPVTVKNSDDTYNVSVQAGDTLVLPDITHTDSDGSSVTEPAQTAFVATPCGSCADGTVENSDASFTDTVASGGTLVLSDITIFESDGVTSLYTVPAAINYTLSGVTVNDGATTTTVEDGSTYDCKIISKIYWEAGESQAVAEIDADTATTYTSDSDDGGSGTITYEVDTGSGYASDTLPITVSNGDKIRATRTTTTSAGFVKLTD